MRAQLEQQRARHSRLVTLCAALERDLNPSCQEADQPAASSDASNTCTNGDGTEPRAANLADASNACTGAGETDGTEPRVANLAASTTSDTRERELSDGVSVELRGGLSEVPVGDVVRDGCASEAALAGNSDPSTAHSAHCERSEKEGASAQQSGLKEAEAIDGAQLAHPTEPPSASSENTQP